MSRFSVKISPSELWTKFIEDSKKFLLKTEEFTEKELMESSDDKIVHFLFSYGTLGKIQKDLEKVQFDFENLTLSKDDFGNVISDWMGVQQTGDLTFIGGYAGGDWEIPVAFAIYHDGKTWRGYVPEDGNTYNHDLKCAYGSEEEVDENWTEPEEDEDALEPDYSTAVPDVEKMKRDIAARIVVR